MTTVVASAELFSPGDLTAILAAVAAVLASLTPAVMARRKNAAIKERGGVVTFEAINQRIDKERQGLQDRLDKYEQICEERIAASKLEGQRELAEQRAEFEATIADLRQEISRLQRIIRRLSDDEIDEERTFGRYLPRGGIHESRHPDNGVGAAGSPEQ